MMLGSSGGSKRSRGWSSLTVTTLNTREAERVIHTEHELTAFIESRRKVYQKKANVCFSWTVEHSLCCLAQEVQLLQK